MTAISFYLSSCYWCNNWSLV